MIKIIDGDLFNTKADIIAHQVNCSNAMNSGVAKQIRERYPEVFKAYQSLCKLRYNCEHTLLGECQVIEVDENRSIANLFGQLGYGYDGQQYTDIGALKRAMIKLRNRCSLDKENITIAMPYGLGSVRGGAKWEDVYAIIEEVFNDMDVELWRLDKG
jgi:O-acetyl-ADP-ribose deacetylase (regulator of RNase III)